MQRISYVDLRHKLAIASHLDGVMQEPLSLQEVVTTCSRFSDLNRII
jgi:hypothetical protein